MNVYAYKAALYCEDCAEAIMQRLRGSDASESGCSDTYPQGPYGNGGGEADCPQYCSCGMFLENPLTPEGLDYVRETLAEPVTEGSRSAKIHAHWREFYGSAL